MREERELMEAKMDVQRQETEKLRTQVFEAKLHAVEKEAKLHVAQAEVQAELRIERETRFAEQLATLQARLETLYNAKLLADEELHAVEDAIVDAVSDEDGEGGVAEKLIALSSRVSSDRVFARQLQRKKWS